MEFLWRGAAEANPLCVRQAENLVQALANYGHEGHMIPFELFNVA